MCQFNKTMQTLMMLKKLRKSNWPQIPDHSYRMLINRSSKSRKTNFLLNLIYQQPDVDKIYLYNKELYEEKYQFLTNKRENTGFNHFNYPKAFIE